VRLLFGFSLALLMSVTAHAEVPPAKPLPSGLTHEELRLWAKAQMHERRGELSWASGNYRDLLNRTQFRDQKRPLPAVFFNLARIYLRGGDDDSAVSEFEKYLEQAPTAADAPQIKKLIDELRKKPQWIYVGTHERTDQEVDATVIIDGELAGKYPWRFPADKRKDHVIARIGKRSLIVNDFDPRSRTKYELVGTNRGHSASSKDKGNVWLDFYAKSVDNVQLDGQPVDVNKLITLRPGRYTTTLGDKELCAPITFDIKPGVLNFVAIIATSGQHGHYGCWDVEKLRVHHVPWDSL
jgi:hypothetical protein